MTQVRRLPAPNLDRWLAAAASGEARGRSRLLRALVMGGATLTLAGCMGTGSTNPLVSEIESLPRTIDMPTSGSAVFTGPAYMDILDVDLGDMDGRATITADFDTGRVSGEFTDFVNENGRRFDGGATFADAAIVDGRFSAALEGELSRFDSAKNNRVGAYFVPESQVEGEFRGSDAEGVIGIFGGQVIHFEGDQPQQFTAPVTLKGSFAGTSD
ncbi:MAG: transferrin-binding protein-like solute binding protein [Rhodobacteraceae bacterium]|jgi:hypothetical protein|nr:transferrin-binding protein-like solute binding protein [Paracoccaceae bacterium]